MKVFQSGWKPLRGVGVFVERRAVETAESVGVGREVRRHPVDEDADAVLMAVIDEEPEIVRLAVPAGGSEVPGRLVAHDPSKGYSVIGISWMCV